MTRRPNNRDDRGATAITIAISMLVLMGFTAITIDGGLAYGDRRVLASAADVGALAALQFARPSLIDVFSACDTTVSLEDQAACRGAEEAIEVVNGTLPGRFALLNDWKNCLDLTKPVEFTIDANVGGTPIPCISFTANFSKSRVKMPDTDLPTTFGRLIGFNSITTGANAEAGNDLSSFTRVKPWAQGQTGADSDQVCLMANSANSLTIPPCDGPASGNFGKLDIALYGEGLFGTGFFGTPQICGPSMSKLKMATNIIVGADHLLVKEDEATGEVNDFAFCPILSEHIDEVRTKTGNDELGISQGFFDGIADPDLEGLLMCKGPPSSDRTREDLERDPVLISRSCADVHSFFPEDLDDTPLWFFINPNNDLRFGLCPPPGSPMPIDNRQDMVTCLDAWKGISTPNTYLFENDIATSPRYGAVPILIGFPSGGVGDYLIKEFRPIYISTLYLNCKGPTCTIVHSPDEASTDVVCEPPPVGLTGLDNSCGWPLSGLPAMKVSAVTSFMLTVPMLHPDLVKNFPEFAGNLVLNLTK